MSHSDNPVDFRKPQDDWLDRRPSVMALKRLLESPRRATPLVVGIYGGWGTGKTSVMQTLRRELASPDQLALWFDAWIFARQEQALWRALLLRVVEALRAKRGVLPEYERKAVQQDLDEAQSRLYQSLSITEHGGVKFSWSGLSWTPKFGQGDRVESFA